MAYNEQSTVISHVLELLSENGLEAMAGAMSTLLNFSMEQERTAFLGADRYERSDDRRGRANGFKPKTVTSRLGRLPLRIPQVRETRNGEQFYPQSLEKGERSERALKLAVAEMWVKGVSTRKVKAITEQLCGTEISSMQVSRCCAELDVELQSWRNRPLSKMQYMILDTRYEKVRHAGSVVSCAVLIAVGVSYEGKRSVLGVSVALSEAEVHWRNFLSSLVERGLHGMKLITSDSHEGLKSALDAVFPAIPWQRCQFHLQQNAGCYLLNKEQRRMLAHGLRSVFDAPDRPEAERQLGQLSSEWEEKAPRLAEWLLDAVPEGLQVFAMEPSHRKRLRTSNTLERLNREVKRRTRVATLFPNEDSLLRLVTAVLIEISEDWETGRVYLS